MGRWSNWSNRKSRKDWRGWRNSSRTDSYRNTGEGEIKAMLIQLGVSHECHVIVMRVSYDYVINVPEKWEGQALSLTSAADGGI